MPRSPDTTDEGGPCRRTRSSTACVPRPAGGTTRPSRAPDRPRLADRRRASTGHRRRHRAHPPDQQRPRHGRRGSQPSSSGRCVTTTTWSIPARRLPVPAVRHVEDVAADECRRDLVPVRPGVIVGRLRHLDLAALVQRDVTAGQPVEQRSGLVVLVRDEAVHRHRAVHDPLAHGTLPCFGVPPKLAWRELSLL